MEDVNAHPNTQALLDAWRRLSDDGIVSGGPTTADYPDLVGRLFVLNHVAERDYCFRRVGYSIERLFGRQLLDHNFLTQWSEPDRRLVAAALSAAAADRGPALIRARGETLTGRRIDLEFALAPLLGGPSIPRRFLGLCQSMTGEALLHGRPLRRLQAIALYPPAPSLDPEIRLVSTQ